MISTSKYAVQILEKHFLHSAGGVTRLFLHLPDIGQKQSFDGTQLVTKVACTPV